jgi:hypothetical protein
MPRRPQSAASNRSSGEISISATPAVEEEAQPNTGAFCDSVGSLLRIGSRARFKQVIVEVKFLGRTHFAGGLWAGVQVLWAVPPQDGRLLPKSRQRSSPLPGPQLTPRTMAGIGDVLGQVAQEREHLRDLRRELGLEPMTDMAGNGAKGPSDSAVTAAETQAARETVKHIGKHDGQMHGVRYFSCAPRSGLFVRPRSLTLVHDKQLR